MDDIFANYVFGCNLKILLHRKPNTELEEKNMVPTQGKAQWRASTVMSMHGIFECQKFSAIEHDPILIHWYPKKKKKIQQSAIKLGLTQS